jgi:hypothetical protein
MGFPQNSQSRRSVVTTPKLTTHRDVDQEIIECWRLLMKAEEAGRRLTVDERGDHNEAWVDATDELLAARIAVSARARVVPVWSPEMDEWPEQSCVDLTREVAHRYQAIPLELEPPLWSLAVVHVADAFRAVERAAAG